MYLKTELYYDYSTDIIINMLNDLYLCLKGFLSVKLLLQVLLILVLASLRPK
jgi:hypothetical protein